jgi:hypothetical protein
MTSPQDRSTAMSEMPISPRISPLRRRMIEDMTVRQFVEKTQADYIRHVRPPPPIPRCSSIPSH